MRLFDILCGIVAAMLAYDCFSKDWLGYCAMFLIIAVLFWRVSNE